MNDVRSIYLVGAGSHSVFLTGTLFAKVAYYSGYDVKNTSVIALGVIGGAVASQVRYGQKVTSPLMLQGQADVLVAFDKLEALRHLDQLKDGALLITSSEIVPPTSVTGLIEEPFTCSYNEHFRQKTGNVVEIAMEVLEIGKRHGDSVLWGVFAAFQPFSNQVWEKSISEMFNEDILDIKVRGFYLGKSYGEKIKRENCIDRYVRA